MYDGTVTSLAGNGTFTGMTRISERDDRIVGTVFADQAGTVHIQQSCDGTNWDVDTSYAVTANTGAHFSEEIVAPLWRIVFVNGATPQTVFRLSARTSSGGSD